MVLLHIFCLIPRPHILNMTDHKWPVLNMICQVSVPGLTEWERAQNVVHRTEKKKKRRKNKSNWKAHLEDQYSLPLHLLLPRVWAVGLHPETSVWSLRSQCHRILQTDTKTPDLVQQCSEFAQEACGGVATCLKRTGKFLTQIPSKGVTDL